MLVLCTILFIISFVFICLWAEARDYYKHRVDILETKANVYKNDFHKENKKYFTLYGQYLFLSDEIKFNAKTFVKREEELINLLKEKTLEYNKIFEDLKQKNLQLVEEKEMVEERLDEVYLLVTDKNLHLLEVIDSALKGLSNKEVVS